MMEWFYGAPFSLIKIAGISIEPMEKSHDPVESKNKPLALDARNELAELNFNRNMVI